MFKTKTLTAAALMAATLLLAACASGPYVKTDQDPSADFGRYRTWGFYSPLAMEQSGYSSWITDRIKDNVRREMSARGYAYNEKSPDLKVNFQGVVRDRTAVYSMPVSDVQLLYSYRARAYVAVPVWYDQMQVSRYQEGTLSIDLVDAKQNRMVWTGDAIATVERMNVQERAANIDKTISAVFAKYPYQAGSNQPVVPAKK